MATLPVYNRAGEKVDQIEIDPAAIAPRISPQLLHEVVVMYERNRRHGTAKTKSRSEVAGSTKKMYRQKGTGNARAGSRRSPIRRGGGHTFAKRPRDWYFRLPRKAVQLATRMALASKLSRDQVVVIDELSFAAPKTREMAGILKALKLSDQTCTLATAAYDKFVYLSARNIAGVEVSPVGDLNAYTILRPRKLLLTRAALEKVQQRPVQTTSA